MNIIQKYQKLNLKVSYFKLEEESIEYEACQFKVENQIYLGRTAKLTPKKSGLFVTLWKRNSNKITVPYNELDAIDFVIILVSENDKCGYFKFPKTILLEKGILSTKTKDGKRGFRVYPPWSETKSKQANKTQNWQINHFHFLE